MAREERAQCGRDDAYWGVDAGIRMNEAMERDLMRRADLESVRFEQVHEEALHVLHERWKQMDTQIKSAKRAREAERAAADRADYMRVFKSSKSRFVVVVVVVGVFLCVRLWCVLCGSCLTPFPFPFSSSILPF